MTNLTNRKALVNLPNISKEPIEVIILDKVRTDSPEGLLDMYLVSTLPGENPHCKLYLVYPIALIEVDLD